MAGLKASVRIPRAEGPEAPPPEPARSASGGNARVGLIVGGHLVVLLVGWALLFRDIGLEPTEKGILIGVIVRDAFTAFNRIYDYFLPQND